MPRPPSYQRATVLEQATEVFWQRGYGATSVAELVAATGLRPGSLYAAFGSKKGLFLEVLDRYHEDYLREADACLDASRSPLTAIKELFDRTADAAAAEGGRRGCLAVNAMLEMAQHDAEIARLLSDQSTRLRKRLAAMLETARERGELGPGKDPELLSIFLLNNLWGMRVMCKSAPTRGSLQAIVDGVMSALTHRMPSAPY